jgi:glutamate/aspartate transport system permease protein
MNVVADNLGFLLQGFAVNMAIAVLAIPAGMLVAIPLALARLSRSAALYFPATVYVNVLRSSPLLMVLFWLYFLAPIVLGRQMGAFSSVVIGLSFFEAAYFAEIIRSGIQGVPIGQRLAGLATGLDAAQTYLRIILPQALRNMRPSLLTQSVIAFQDTTLASILGVLEIDQAAKVINSRELVPGPLYSFIALAFFVVCFVVSRAAARLDRAAST